MGGKRHLLPGQKSSDRKNGITDCMKEKRNREGVNWFVVLLAITLVLFGSVRGYAAYASELGGFDISTGTGEFDGDWSDWDDEPAYDTPEQGSDSNQTDDVRNDGQEIQGAMEGIAADHNDYENDTAANWNTQDSFDATESGSTSYVQRYAEEYESQNSNGSRTENRTGMTGDVSENTSNSEMFPTVLPTNTLTPIPTPTSEPTNTPTPVFTEVPQEEVNTVTEYREEYYLPPAECLRKMRLFCWKETLPGGEAAEIQLNEKIVQNIISVQVNGQEKEWETETKGRIKTLKIYGLSEERNDMKLALMLPADLTWTGDKKNVILTYTILKDKR